MKNDIKTVYLDSRGGQHESKADAAKSNRLISAAKKFAEAVGVEGGDLSYLLPNCDDGGVDEQGRDIIEYSRAVVAIHGMKDGK